MRDGSLLLFASLQFVWIGLATLGLWTDLRGLFGDIDEQVWMFGITLPATLLSLWISRQRSWRTIPALIGISTGLHFILYFLPLFILMGAPMNVIALREIAELLAYFAFAYACAVVGGTLVFSLILRKDTAQ